MKIFAIDPGSKKSGYVLLEGDSILESGHIDNADMCDLFCDRHAEICDGQDVRLYCEDIILGQRVGKDVADTLKWIGKFQAQAEYLRLELVLIPRGDVRAHFDVKFPRSVTVAPEGIELIIKKENWKVADYRNQMKRHYSNFDWSCLFPSSDTQIRHALIERFGQGWNLSLVGHAWQAAALAVMMQDIISDGDGGKAAQEKVLDIAGYSPAVRGMTMATFQ